MYGGTSSGCRGFRLLGPLPDQLPGRSERRRVAADVDRLQPAEQPEHQVLRPVICRVGSVLAPCRRSTAVGDRVAQSRRSCVVAAAARDRR